jgi:hypothetical protein
MAIYVDSMSAPTAGGGTQTFIATDSWELVMTGMDDFHEPIAERKPLAKVLKEWLADPDDADCDGGELAELIISGVNQDEVPVQLRHLIRKVLMVAEAE